jgi:hypothetical protein
MINKLLYSRSNLLFISIVIFATGYHLFSLNLFLPLYYLLGLICFILNVKFWSNHKIFLGTIFCVIIFANINMLIHQRLFISIFNFIASFSIALFIIINIKHNFFKIALIIYLFAFFLFLFKGGDVNFFLYNKSVNHISAYIISLSALSIFIDFQLFHKVKRNTYLIIVLAWIATFFTYGRMGILSMTILFIGLNIFFFKINASLKKISFFLTIIILILYNGYDYFLNNNSIPILFKFYKNGFDSWQRELIINTYFNQINIKTFLFGVSDETIKKITTFSLHNSYLEIHSYIGMGILPILFYSLKGLFYLNKKNFGLFIVFLAFLLRGFTDTFILFSGVVGGICLFLPYFYQLTNNSNNDKKNQNT